MGRKFNLFNFLEKKIDTSEISPVTQNLLDQVAFKELALHIGISYIANTISKCEFKTYENGKFEKNKLYYMLNVSPNPNQNSSQFINQFIEQCFYYGSALIVPNGDYIYCADNFDIEDSNPLKENTFYNVVFNNYELKKKHKANEVFFFQLGNDSVKALIDSLYLQYGEIIDQAFKAFKRTNGTKYKMILENYKAGDSQFNQIFKDVLQTQLKTFVDNDNAVYPQFKGIDLQEFSSAAPRTTADILSLRKEVFEVVAQALKIPLSMMYGNITNMNEIVKVFLSNCIDPLADMIGEEITRKYYSFDEWKKGNKVVVDTTCINHIDIFEISDKADKAFASGLANIDELRKIVGLDELDTDFSTRHFITKNYALAEDMLKSTESIEGG